LVASFRGQNTIEFAVLLGNLTADFKEPGIPPEYRLLGLWMVCGGLMASVWRGTWTARCCRLAGDSRLGWGAANIRAFLPKRVPLFVLAQPAQKNVGTSFTQFQYPRPFQRLAVNSVLDRLPSTVATINETSPKQ
jgi:hypothetical protein